LFWLILAEAGLLTLKTSPYILSFKKHWPVIAAGRVHGGNAGLAFAMCAAQKKRKKRQGGWKHRYGLMFGYFASKVK
jgi:hypothetical protein